MHWVKKLLGHLLPGATRGGSATTALWGQVSTTYNHATEVAQWATSVAWLSSQMGYS